MASQSQNPVEDIAFPSVVHEPLQRREACNALFRAKGIIQARIPKREAARRRALVCLHVTVTSGSLTRRIRRI